MEKKQGKEGNNTRRKGFKQKFGSVEEMSDRCKKKGIMVEVAPNSVALKPRIRKGWLWSIERKLTSAAGRGSKNMLSVTVGKK